MSHLDEGRLRALLDGELGEAQAEAQAHVEACRACRGRFELAEAEDRMVSAALALLDTAEPRASAREELRGRVAGASSVARPRPIARFPLARAAIIVLFFGAAGASALPGSPLRGLWIAGWERTAGLLGSAAVSTEGDPEATAEQAAPAGIVLEVDARPLRVLLSDAASGTLVVVRFTDEVEARAFAGEGARFRFGEGRIEVSGASGTVELELPRSATETYVEVDGRMYLTRVGNVLDVAGPVEARTPNEVRLRIR